MPRFNVKNVLVHATANLVKVQWSCSSTKCDLSGSVANFELWDGWIVLFGGKERYYRNYDVMIL